MKISRLEKILVCCTAVFLLLTAGYYLGVCSSADPYRVDVEAQREVPVAPATAPAPAAPADKLNLNTATEEELQQLPGIGEQRAADIVADRTQNGPFRIPEDITRVKGIGEGTLSGIIDLITAS